MPICEYRCESCSHRLEKLQRMSEGDLVDCPECKKPALKRLRPVAAHQVEFRFSYENDFKKDNKRNLADSSGKGSSNKKSSGGAGEKTGKSSSASSANKSDAKPAAKPAAKEAKHT